MHDPNYEVSTHRGPRSAVDRHAINLVGNLLLTGVWLEHRLTRTLTPSGAARESSALRAPPDRTVITGASQFKPLRRAGS